MIVLSYTSSSNDRLPGAAPMRMWIFSVVLATAVLSSAEVFWRSMGYSPTVQDDCDLWCLQRERVEDAPPRSIVLVGHSRIHQGWVAEEFEKAAPGFEQIQLGFFKAQPISVVRDIAETTEYSGIVFCSVLSFSLLPENWRPNEFDENCGPLVNYYHNRWSINEKADRTVSNFFQSNLVVAFPDLAPHKVAPDLVRGEWPVQYVWTEADRMQHVDYDKIDLKRFSDRQMHFLVDNSEKCFELNSYKTWPSDTGYDELDRYVQIIQDRGGHVVFHRPVTTGAFEEYLEKHFPRKEFWDRFVKNTSATTIHFDEIPTLAKMTCPDGSHLSREDAHTFTRLMAEELIRRGIIEKSN